MLASMEGRSRRQRQRQQLIDDVLVEARSQLERGGPSSVSLRAIARAVGMSAPSLYTYFASLGDIFTSLIVQSFDDLGAAVGESVEATNGRPLEVRLAAGPRAYRTWAVDHRQQFNLVFFDQIAGYQAPPDGPTVHAQEGALRPIAAVYAEARNIDLAALGQPGDELDGFLAFWAGFHGVVALEVNHHLDWVDPRTIFEHRLRADIAVVLRR